MKRMISLALALCMVLSLAACGSSPGTSPGTSQPVGPAVPPASGPTVNANGEKVLRIAEIKSPETLGNLRLDGYGTVISQNISDSLVRINADMDLEPGLATSWEWIDETTWQFKLREGVVFTNGEAFNAEAAAFNLNALVGQELSYRWSSHWGSAWPITAEVVDEYTLNVTTSEPSAFVPNLITRIVFYAPAQWQAEGDETYFTHPAGTGPYEVESWDIGISMTLKKAETEYWDGSSVYFDKIVIDAVSSDAARISGLQSGEYDIVESIPFDQVQHLTDVSGGAYTIHTYDSVGLNWLHLNGYNENSWMKEQKFRQAVAHAIDAEAISETLFGGVCDARSFVAPATTIGGDEGYSQPYAYDPDLSRRLLAEIGYDGAQIDFFLSEGEFANDISTGEFIAASLNAVGINCVISQLETSVSDERRKAGEGDLFLINTPGSFGGMSDYYWNQMSSKRGYDLYPGFEAVSGMYQKAVAFGLSDQERENLLREANMYLWNLCPVLFSVDSSTVIGTRAGLQGVYASANSWVYFKNAFYEE